MVNFMKFKLTRILLQKKIVIYPSLIVFGFTSRFKEDIKEMKIVNFIQIIYILLRFAIGNKSKGEVISFKLKQCRLSLKLKCFRAQDFSVIFLSFLKNVEDGTIQVTLF